MITSTFALRSAIAFLISACLLAGCGGSKVLKESEPLAVTQSLATTSDQRLAATLDWVIVRDGPGTWAKNVDWDEYLMRAQNLGDSSIQITDITVVDSLGTKVEPAEDRKQLVKGTKKTKKRYKGEDLKVRAGAGAGTMIVAGAVTGAAAASLGAAAVFGSTAVAGAALGGLLLAPVIAVGGVMRGVNNSKVNNQIELRQTLLPLEIPARAEVRLDVFFPLAPSPKRVELVYTDATGEHSLVIDTSTALDGLHIDAPED